MTETDMIDGAPTLQELATKATKEIFDHIMEKLRHPDSKDTSYLRALFRQNGEYGCTIVIDVTLNDYDKQAHIVTRFGAKP